jgi:HKD family nuclease
VKRKTEPRLRLLVLPYDSVQGVSLVKVLIDELQSSRWIRFSAAVAYARASANYLELLEALEQFAATGRTVALTFGANMSGSEPTSDYEVFEQLATRLDFPNARIHLYNEPSRLFHPKLYLFDNEKLNRALLIVGSSNWTHGGLMDNVETNLVANLNLTCQDDRAVYDVAQDHFRKYWQE